MRYRLVTLVLSGMFVLGTAALAQDQGQTGLPAGHPTHAMRSDPDRQLARLTQKLNLTADQQTQIRPILVDRQQKLHGLMQNQSLAPDDRRSQSRSIMSDSNSRIEAVLNDTQKPKFEAMQQQRRSKNRGTTGSAQTTSPPPSTQPQ
jgi:periplasmic protein CpxP/Spy